MRFSFWCGVLFVLLIKLSFAQEYHPKNSIRLIEDAFESGTITEEKAMDLKINILRRDTLPSLFRSDIPIKCGFGIAAEAHEYFKKRPDKKLGLQKTSMQEIYNHSFVVNGQTKTFRINYDVSGPNAVPSLDANANSLPDWVEETGLAFERSYRLEVDTMGYREPLSFAAFGYYEVFILDLNDTYGYTWAIEPPVTSNPYTYKSYIEVENDYAEGFATHGYDALRVTCGHEFMHAIQFSYNFRLDDTWYYELSSTWMEDVTYDDVNDYYAYLPGYFNSPQTSLDNTDGYSAAHWNHMIEKKYGRNTIKKSWEYMISRNAIQSIDDAIKWASNSNSDLSKNFSEFTVWNYYTAWRADTITYFPEAAHYPKIKQLSNLSIRDISLEHEAPALATNYYSFYVLDTTHVEINFHATQSNSFFDVYSIEYNKTTGKNFFLNRGSSSVFRINNLLQGDTLVCVVVNKVIDQSISNNYEYTLGISIKEDMINTNPISNFYFYPSPFVLKSTEDKMNFKFVLGKTSNIEFHVYTIAGKLLKKISYGEFGVGSYDGKDNILYWDGKDSNGNFVPSGVYIYQFIGNGFKKTGKIAIVR